MKRGPKGMTLERVIDALKKANGNMSLAARSLQLDRSTIKHYVDTYPAAKEAHDEAAAHISDIAEGHLVSAVIKGNLDQVRYWLENKARDRGYGRGPSQDPQLNLTPEQLAEMTDTELDELASKLAKLTRRG